MQRFNLLLSETLDHQREPLLILPTPPAPIPGNPGTTMIFLTANPDSSLHEAIGGFLHPEEYVQLPNPMLENKLDPQATLDPPASA
jgi:hypothetical protein